MLIFAIVSVVTAGLLWIVRDLLSHWMAGLQLRIERAYKIGDWLQCEGSGAGRVVAIGWRTTTLMTVEGQELVLPNRLLLNSVIRKWPHARPGTERSITVECPAQAPPDRVRTIILECLQDCPGVSSDPPPRVLNLGATDHGVRYGIEFRVEHSEPGEQVESALRDVLWYAFERHGITFGPSLQGPAVAREAMGNSETFLRTIPLFAKLPAEALAELARTSRSLRYAKGETIVRQGAMDDEMFFICSGEVAVLLKTAGRRVGTESPGRRRLLRRAGPPDRRATLGHHSHPARSRIDRDRQERLECNSRSEPARRGCDSRDARRTPGGPEGAIGRIPGVAGTR